MNKKYIVRLTDEERKQLEKTVSKGKTQAYKIKHANVLLKRMFHLVPTERA
ncbi:MAG: hypothetical protein QME42_11805 [bacterium]|nr:hypothetical protein [bacterium]